MFDCPDVGQNSGHEPSASAGGLRCIALIGGGRWSRVILPVLRDILPIDCEIAWITHHGYDRAVTWLSERALPGISIHQSRETLTHRMDAAIVATTPANHAQQVHELISQNIPTFCEKPLTTSFEHATRLIDLANCNCCPLGVNLELHYASYLDQFVDLMKHRLIQKVDILWLDPWTEQRYGETKHGDFYTDIVHDMWPHCWSVLRRLAGGGSSMDFDSVSYHPIDGAQIAVRCPQWSAGIRLSRRNGDRVRRIEINGGQAILEFSQEPGWSEIDGTTVQHAWHGPRPLTRSLQSFLDVVMNFDLLNGWPLQAASCLDSVRLADHITSKLNEIYLERVSRLRESGVDLNSASCRNVIIDVYLPLIAAQGRRWPACTELQQIEFVKHICTTQLIRYY